MIVSGQRGRYCGGLRNMVTPVLRKVAFEVKEQQVALALLIPVERYVQLKSCGHQKPVVVG